MSAGSFSIGGGSSDTLHISFSFEKTDLESQNTGRVTIWNLNDAHRAQLEQKDCPFALRAGYGGRNTLLFSGIVSNASYSLDGADRQLEIEVVDNLVQVRDTFVSVSYNGTVNWKEIFDDTAGQMGVAVVYSYNAEFSDVSNGFSFVGAAKDIITKGCDCNGLSWSLQNGVLQIKRIGDVLSMSAYELSEDTGLIGIPKRVVITEDTAVGKNSIGWDVEFFLNGAIGIDDYVHLRSKEVSGYFRVYSIKHDGDNVSGDWMSSARLLEIN